MKFFKYPVEVLIKGIGERPVLWDKTMELYKDREEKKQAWKEIYRILDDGYDDMSREDKKATGEIITNKWTNIRDTFIKSLKTQSSRSKTRKYVYHDEMSFLLKVLPQQIIPDPFHDGSDDDPISYKTEYIPLKQEMIHGASDGEASTSSPKDDVKIRLKKIMRPSSSYMESADQETPRKRSKKSDPQNSETEENPMDFVAINEVNDPRVMNEDEAFFASLLPTVVKYSEDERLDFRIEVLAVMRNIAEKRKSRWSGEPAD